MLGTSYQIGFWSGGLVSLVSFAVVWISMVPFILKYCEYAFPDRVNWWCSTCINFISSLALCKNKRLARQSRPGMFLLSFEIANSSGTIEIQLSPGRSCSHAEMADSTKCQPTHYKATFQGWEPGNIALCSYGMVWKDGALVVQRFWVSFYLRPPML